MKSNIIRDKYLSFFEKEKDHKRIKASPLVLEGDPSTLFTSSGMQQLVPYLKGEKHPKGKRLVNSQPSLRTQDIEEVGDNRHTTFFEMLGNWSLGDYFKEDQLAWCLEFFTKEMGLPKDKLFISVFEGTEGVAKDTESAEIWKKLGIPKKRIYFYGTNENWWSMTGPPDKMKKGDIGGPDSEVFYEFSQVKHNPEYGKECHPGCGCGRFLEIGNSVFIQYQKEEDGSLIELAEKNVDFGGGLERITAAVNNIPDIFMTDMFESIINKIEKISSKSYKGNEKPMRVIADHMRAAVALINDGVLPGKKKQESVLRRLIRISATEMRNLSTSSTVEFGRKISGQLGDYKISTIVGEEIDKFEIALIRGVRVVQNNSKIKPFDLYQTYGIPFEVVKEIFQKTKNVRLTQKDRKEFEVGSKKHKRLSKTASSGMFKGGLADESSETIKLHTVTHLLHTSLRKVLGEHVEQKGSNINNERLRFDFSHSAKLTDEEIERVENLINEQIKKKLPVTFEEKSLDEALKEGALAFFSEKYERRVKVYTIGDSKGKWFSKEVCGGPHVTNTSEVGRVKIKRQEKVGAGTIRLYAVVE